jgi:hypothetical protein
LTYIVVVAGLPSREIGAFTPRGPTAVYFNSLAEREENALWAHLQCFFSKKSEK